MVTSMQWWGSYWSGGPCGPGANPDDFTITFYADLDGLPGEVLETWAEQVPSGFRLGGGAVQEAPGLL